MRSIKNTINNQIDTQLWDSNREIGLDCISMSVIYRVKFGVYDAIAYRTSRVAKIIDRAIYSVVWSEVGYAVNHGIVLIDNESK